MKAQASMEFLMTYGWAILVVMLMISGLAYLGVINPAQWVPNKCTFGAGLSCQEYIVFDDTSGERVNIYLTNSFGNTITVKDVNLTDMGSNAGCSCATSTCNLDGVWRAADNKLLDFSCTNNVESVNLKIRIKYSYIDGEYDRLIEGRLQSRVGE